MKKSGILLLLALLCLFLLAACGPDGPEAVSEDSPASEVAIAEATAEEVSAEEVSAEEAAPTATETEPPPPTETAVPPTATVEPTATEEAAAAEEEALPTPTVEPTLEPNPEVLESNCLSCHSNKELLMDLAEPEEEPEESESSGVG
jgi:outer membrane biosynthesis protein TonB